MDMVAKIFTLVIVIICTCILQAQEYTVDVQQFGIKDGLADRDVLYVFKDRSEFLWVQTKADLQRFDGQEFETFDLGKFENDLEQILRSGYTTDDWIYVLYARQSIGKRALIFLNSRSGQILTAQEKLGKQISEQMNVLLDLETYRLFDNNLRLDAHPDQLFFSGKMTLSYSISNLA